MALENIDNIVLGHNSFFGVNHLSQEQGERTAAKFEQAGPILDMIRFSMERGVRGMMMSTHPRAAMVAEAVRADGRMLDQLNLYPLLPYIAKYVRQSNEKGVVNVIMDQVKGAGIGQTLGLFARGGMAMLRKDVFQILKTLIQMELMPFRGLRMRAVFLHDVLSDLALSLDMRSIFEFYVEEIRDKYEAEPAFATKNLPLMVRRLKDYGIERPLILSHFNQVGFNMNPSQEACERCLVEEDLQIMAMGTLASGYLKPDEAYKYLFGLAKMDSVVVGVSNPSHAEQTFAAIHTQSKSNSEPRQR
ncbi:MAG: hypothetical protein MI923_16715 [Phycisphaerales bacterium]|nr:hypothetical protein [Phycisphaerales bacterium]